MRFSLIVLAAAITLSACGGGGGGSSAPLSLFFDAPPGSGATSGVAQTGMGPGVMLDLVLSNGIAVTGTISDSLGAPMTSADIKFVSAIGLPEMASDNADGAGAYSVTLPEGTWIAIVDSNSSTLGEMTVSGIAVVGPGPVMRDFQFPAEATISGTVTDPQGLPVPSADVTFKGASTGIDQQVTTDAQGFYTLSAAPDSFAVTVEPTGVPATTLLKQRWPQVNVTMTATVDFSLTAGVQVSGTVLTNLGVPFLDETDVDVMLPPGSPYFPPQDVTADSNTGTYSIGPVPPGSVSFELKPPGGSGFPQQLVGAAVVGPAVQTIDLTLIAGVVLSGTVLQDDGATPDVNAKVEAFPANPSVFPPDNDRTDATGFYEISVFPGTYTIQVTPDTTANFQLPQQQSASITGATVLNVTLARGAMVSGTVLDTTGINPVQDIEVSIQGALGAIDTTDGAGAYSFLAPIGTHTLTLRATNGPFQDMALEPVTGVVVALPGPITTNITLAFALTGSTVIQGTVFLPDGTTPAVGSEVTAVSNATGDTLGRTISGPGGIYVLVIP